MYKTEVYWSLGLQKSLGCNFCQLDPQICYWNEVNLVTGTKLSSALTIHVRGPKSQFWVQRHVHTMLSDWQKLQLKKLHCNHFLLL
jgi:hypothetical protein